jgi:hypothetical protein
MKKIEDFLPEYVVNTFEDIVVALIIATVAVTGIYYELFIPSIIQIIVLSIILKYKKFKSDTDRAVEASIKLKKANSDAEKENAKNEYYGENSVLRTIKIYVSSSFALIFIAILFVWYFPFTIENNNRSLDNSINNKLINKIDSLKMDINSLKDSLSLIKLTQQTNISHQQKLQSNHVLSK